MHNLWAYGAVSVTLMPVFMWMWAANVASLNPNSNAPMMLGLVGMLATAPGVFCAWLAIVVWVYRMIKATEPVKGEAAVASKKVDASSVKPA